MSDHASIGSHYRYFKLIIRLRILIIDYRTALKSSTRERVPAHHLPFEMLRALLVNVKNDKMSGPDFTYNEFLVYS
jgi:hypothetical protein